MLLVASDRLSAYDVIMPTPIPEKGRVLTEVANFWFAKLAPHRPQPPHRHRPGERGGARGARAGARALHRGEDAEDAADRGGRARLPRGLRLEGVPGDRRASAASSCLPGCSAPPSSRSPSSPRPRRRRRARTTRTSPSSAWRRSWAEARAKEVRDVAIRLYTAAAEFALTKGIIIADTKFEFGVDAAGRLHLIDEALTPDSSRFWPLATYKVGESPESFDKQYIRNWLDSIGFARKPPAPAGAARGGAEDLGEVPGSPQAPRRVKRTVLLDMGGVLVELGGERPFLEMIGEGIGAEEMWRRWLASPSVRAHETGRMDTPDVRRRGGARVRPLGEPGGIPRALHAAGCTGPFEGAHDLLDELAGLHRTAILTNISAVHWPIAEGYGLFDKVRARDRLLPRRRHQARPRLLRDRAGGAGRGHRRAPSSSTTTW